MRTEGEAGSVIVPAGARCTETEGMCWPPVQGLPGSNRQMHPGLQEALAASPNGAGLHGHPASSRCWRYLSPRSALFSRTDITAHFHVEIFGPGVSLLLL